ncbi:hypothetical protein [Chryseobacterium sp. 5_R23647]|uniref:hypothetical protein n=1 Tax=Chryseobacterium sp. 5_R23647 TaxID=2258964 RepID=UPI000E27DA14|nr:hypothetical protein [Chryseobacterium sp. 5_R23647]REC45143.1 hypothetical protein DRF69_04550 [Chryseobacterium sp. 5_R23647]
MLGKDILSSKFLKITWIIAVIDILLIYFFFSLTESIILYIVFTSIIVVFTEGLTTVVKGYNSYNLANNFNNNNNNNNNNRKRFANFFVYFLLFFLIMLTIGVMKNLLFDSPLE